MKNNIVILDSGIGGLSVLKMLYKNMPNFNYVYYADTKNLPYGEKTKTELFNITIQNINRIIKDYNPFLIIFGCNTIGMNVFEEVKEHFSNIKMFALTPNIQTALKCNYKQILLLGTTKTIKSISKTAIYNSNKNRIILCKMPLLATKVENYIENPQIIVPYLKRRLGKYFYADCIILGCSHYYFVSSQIKELFKNTKILDGVKNLVKEVKSFLKESDFNLPTNKVLEIKLVITGKTECLEKYNRIIKNIIKNK